jgi:hypothetical protein
VIHTASAGGKFGLVACQPFEKIGHDWSGGWQPKFNHSLIALLQPLLAAGAYLMFTIGI